MKSERDLGELAAKLLQEKGWVLYYEVQQLDKSRSSDRRADIVGVKDDVVMVAELKLTLSLEVLAQAWRWVSAKVANEVWILIPAQDRHRKGSFRDKGRGRHFAEFLCQHFGIGLVEVCPVSYVPYLRVIVPAKTLEEVLQPIKNSLREEHKTWAQPGTKQGGHVTTFALTLAKIREFVELHPGCTVRDIVASVQHHYSSDKVARTTLVTLGKQGNLKGIYVEPPSKESRLLRFYIGARPESSVSA